MPQEQGSNTRRRGDNSQQFGDNSLFGPIMRYCITNMIDYANVIRSAQVAVEQLSRSIDNINRNSGQANNLSLEQQIQIADHNYEIRARSDIAISQTRDQIEHMTRTSARFASVLYIIGHI